jgi:hypothetical protein
MANIIEIHEIKLFQDSKYIVKDSFTLHCIYIYTTIINSINIKNGVPSTALTFLSSLCQQNDGPSKNVWVVPYLFCTIKKF